MAVLTLSQLQLAFFNATVTITGLDPTYVRHTYQNQPAFEQTQNVVFITVKEIEDPYNKQRDVIYTNAADPSITSDQTIAYTRVIEVLWTCYGPSSFDIANQIKLGILTEPILDSFWASSLSPIPSINAPIRAPELVNGQWWERNDISCKFNVLTTSDGTINTFASAQIQVYNTAGGEDVINLP